MRKSLMISFTCNPYLAILQKRHYLKYWKDDIDEILIGINGMNQRVIEFIRQLWADDEKCVFVDIVAAERRQGFMFDRLYPHATGDIIITMDSDNFIYERGWIARTAQMMGGTDAIGSTGYHAFPAEVSQIFIKKYGTVRLNPFVAFFKKKIIDQMPVVTFETLPFKKGDMVDFWGEPMPCDGWFDVMSPFCLRYFKITSKYRTIAQQGPGYLHVGGLSSLYRRFWDSLDLTDNNVFSPRHRDLKPQGLYYWRFYRAIYDATKNEYPDRQYNLEYEKGYIEQVARSHSDEAEMRQQADNLRKEYRGLFDK